MAKKKTRVTLPGSLSDLVKDLQNGNNAPLQHNDDAQQNGGVSRQNGEERTENERAEEENLQQERNANAYQDDKKPINNAEENAQRDAQNAQQNDSEGNMAAESNRPIGNAAEESRAYSPGRPAKQNTMKEYHIVKDDSKDSWDLFLDMAKQYKDGGGKLATIYIDGTLKNILDRMKYVGKEKLPTSAVLSSIVARFIYDHEDEIRKALFSGKLF